LQGDGIDLSLLTAALSPQENVSSKCSTTDRWASGDGHHRLSRLALIRGLILCL